MKPENKKGKEYRKVKVEEILKEKTPIIEKCSPCNLHENNYCNVYLYPNLKWRMNQNCLMATHLVSREVKDQERKRVVQQKQKG